MDSIIQIIKKQINDNKIILYMKGSPELPSCHFSARAVQILCEMNIDFAYINILLYPDIRLALPKIANWPTFPQIWINGNFIGGSDILYEIYNSGELQSIIKE